MMTRILRLGVVTALLLAISALAVACGGGGDDKADIESAVKSSFKAIQDGDIDKYVGSFTKECQEQADKEAIKHVIDELEAAIPDFQVKVDKVEVTKLEGDAATLQITSRIVDKDGKDVPGFETSPEESKAVKQDGQWRNPDCSDLPGAQG